MADGQRHYPVKDLVMHHSVGPEFVNAAQQEISDWFNATGRNRGYAGIAHSGHFDPRTGAETFSQAHYALHQKDGTEWGWELVELIAQPFDNVAWHAGNWPVNQESIGIETCGDYRTKKLPDEALMAVAKFWIPQDKALNGNTFIYPHRAVSQLGTECPAQIADQIDTLLDMVNNYDAWVNKLRPPAPPTPTPAPSAPEWKVNLQPLAPDLSTVLNTDAHLINLENGNAVLTIPAGRQLTVHYATTVGGHKFYLTAYSVDRGIGAGFSAEEVEYPPAPAPTPDPAPSPLPTTEPTTSPLPTPDLPPTTTPPANGTPTPPVVVVQPPVVVAPPQTIDNFLRSLLSRKLLLSLVSAAVPVLNQLLGWHLDVQTLMAIIAPLLTFVGIEGAADIASRVKAPTVSQ